MLCTDRHGLCLGGKCQSFTYQSEYHKIPKYSDTQKIAVTILKFEQYGSTMTPKDAGRMAV